ncbi:MAG: bifunctional phosphopantothenoylcysteine decarboxylase/phosphopantothenate--cysteine ligase CoaBC [Burkholderiaceae bacterium]|jgi:phosphopantothenoylcysteine decarboxylase/phosphopantothenate--cysteine ligase|nr:bifunctional phosphopantothenoylcysteine decarboxylase/phosphopantothenate--cysteine ligase CoaBC [Burkholderiaceae bacterium]
MVLSGKKIVLGLTGGIACYKSAEFLRAMVRDGAQINVVMTDSATHFITPLTLQTLSENPVMVSQWESHAGSPLSHIDVTRTADAIIIAPCTANFAAKLAHGIADDLLSSLCLARPSHVPLLIAPAMNVEMWMNQATRRNIAQLKADGVGVMGPAAGFQACGEVGMGRMLEPQELLAETIAAFQPAVLKNKRVLITAGPTFEPIDPIRGITNRSSGKMGYAVARAAWEAGGEVSLVSGPVALPAPHGVARHDVTTAWEMREKVMSLIADQDVFIAVAAVADWRVANTSTQKIKKTGSAPQLQFEENPDILAEVASLKKPPFCVGFAAESEKLIEHAQEKRSRKNIPLLVGNIGEEAFGKDENELILFDAKGHTVLPRADKLVLARSLVRHIAGYL